ncbi:MAG: DNA polymerase III subunit chi [Tistlia sp.]|uniref:DNA polymerase III subunit chi n=1 Tax=Tistlia sp. TaxID=3057121 RepID=UPI0034A57801
MTEVRFYHLTRTPLEAALPQLLLKTLERGKRALVRLADARRCEALADALWRRDERGFLPHGTAKDGFPAEQPVWLTPDAENANGAGYLFLCDGVPAEGLEGYELCCLLFDGGDGEAVETARGQWRTLAAEGHELSYWQQDERGAWSKRQG